MMDKELIAIIKDIFCLIEKNMKYFGSDKDIKELNNLKNRIDEYKKSHNRDI